MLDWIKNKTNVTIKKLLTLVMALAMTITCVPTTAFAAENDSSSGTEADATVSENEKYVDFSLENSTTTSNDGQIYMGTYVEMSGGTIVKENDKYYLTVSYVDQTYNKSKKTGKETAPAIKIKGYLKAKYNNTEVDLLSSTDYTTVERTSSETSAKYFYNIIKKVKIELEDVKDYSEIEGKIVTLEYQYSSTSAEETAEIKLGKVSDERQYHINLSINESTIHQIWDGRYGADYGKMDSGRKVQIKINSDYSIEKGAVQWYFTDGTEEFTLESEKINTYVSSSDLYQTITADENKPEAYDENIRVKGYLASEDKWTDEATISIPWSKASVFGAVKDSTGKIGVSVGYNGLPYDAKLTVEDVTDQTALDKYGEQLKQLAGNKYGSFYALNVNLTDADGNPVKLQNATGEWGNGYYGTADSYEQDNLTVQSEYTRQLWVYLDKSKGYWPKNTKVYYVDGDTVKELPTPKDSLLPNDYDYTFTTWDTEGQLPNGTYLIMQEPMTDLSEDTAEGDYRVPVQFVQNETDDDGNTIDQWFSTASERNDYLGNNNLAHVNVDKDGNKTLYLTLQDNDGKYLKGVKYNNKTCEKIENYTVTSNDKETTYPKVVKIPLTDTDKNASYITLQVQTEGGWQYTTLAIQYSAMYTYDALAVSAPVISTDTGAANFVNDAEAKVSISADAVGGKIYYTTDGTEPTEENGTLYDKAFTLKTNNKDGETITVKAIAVKDGYAASKVTSYKITFKKEGESAETVKNPLIKAKYDYSKEDNGDTAETGWYQVTLSTDTEDADIYYTLDGTTPTKDSTKYDGTALSVPALTDGKATVIKAIALKDGYNDSEVETKTIEFSTNWWDNLQEGDSIDVTDELVNLGVYINQGIRTQSMGASALTGKATLYVENGKKYLKVPVQPINVSGIPGRLTDMWYFDGNDNNDGKTYAFHFSSKSQDGAIKAGYDYNDDGSISTVTIPLYSDCERVYVGLETNVDIMGKQGSIIWLDYANAIEKVTGQTQVKEEQVAMPTISYEKDEANDSYKVTITAEEGAKIQYSVNSAEGTFEWKDYTEPFTVTGKDAEVVKGTTNVSAKASVGGKKDSNIAAEKLTFKDFGKENRELEDGTYLANVTLRRADNPELESMSHDAIVNPVLITVKDGKYSVTANFHGITVTIGDTARFGYMKNLAYLNSDGSYTDVDVNGYYDTVVDYYNKADDGSAAYLYPRQITFPLVNGKAGDDENGYVHLKVTVPIMEDVNAGSGTQPVFMDIDWSSTEEITQADASELKAALDSAKKKLSQESEYTEESFQVFKKAYEDASCIYYTLNATETQIASAKSALEAAVDGLVEKPVVPAVNKEPLVKKIAEANEELKKTDSYTTSSLKDLQEKVDEAQKILESDDLTEEQVTEQVTILETAMKALKPQADKKDLKAKYEEAIAIYNEGNADDKYTDKAWTAFETAVKNAEAVLNNGDATESEVTAARTALFNTMNDLTVSVDKSALKALLDEANAKDVSDCTDASVKALNAAKASAQAVLDNDDASQESIDKQYKLLTKAMNALVLKVDDSQTVYDGTYTIFGKLWQSTADIPDNWKEDGVTGTSMGDAALNHEIKMTVKDGKATLNLEFVKNEYTLFGEPASGYLKNLAYFPGYTGTTAPTKQTATAAEIVSYWEDEDGNRISDSYGTDYPRYMNIPLDNLGQSVMWVQVYVPIMESIKEGNGTQYAKLLIDWDSRQQVTGIETDKTTLNELITNAKGLEQGTASAETYAALQAALESAENVSADLNASQEVIDATAKLLKAAINAMNDSIVEVDKEELKAQLKEAKEILDSKDVAYTEATLNVLQTAYNNGKDIYDKKDASQNEVNSAVMNLKNAIGDLVKVADKKDLKSAMDKAAAMLKDTDSYTASALDALKQIYDQAKDVYGDSNASQDTVDAVTSALNYMVKHTDKVETVVDKDALAKMLMVAFNMAGRESIYTADSLNALKAAIESAQAVYDKKSATEEEVNAQVSALTTAIVNLEMNTSNSGNNNNGNNGNNGNNNNGGNNGSLDIKNLADGVYSITGNMVKVDKTTASMSDDAINHTIKLTVKNGKYYITLNFKGLTVGQKLGYLSQLKYFTTGYTLDKYGNPQGSLADVTVDSYQKNSDGTLVSDTYGTNYPDEVTFELIPEALKDGYVPLQVFVPIMDAISSGTGTQPVFLKLDWSSIKSTTSDDPNFDNNDNNNSNNNNNNSNGNGNGSSLGNNTLGSNTLGSSTLGSSKLGSSSLTSGSSSLKSGTSSLGSGTGSSLKSASNVKTGDVVQNNTLWAALLLLGGVALMAGLMEYNKKKKANVK